MLLHLSINRHRKQMHLYQRSSSEVNLSGLIVESHFLSIVYYILFQITHGLQSELNRLYSMFCARHPYFEASGGKASIVAHSLGMYGTQSVWDYWGSSWSSFWLVIGSSAERSDTKLILCTGLHHTKQFGSFLPSKLASWNTNPSQLPNTDVHGLPV